MTGPRLAHLFLQYCETTMRQSTIDARLEFNRIDDETISTLRENAAFLVREIDRALDGFYRHIAAAPETKKFFPTAEIVRHAREMQTRHWKMIIDGGFDQNYERSARRIGETHHRLGLEPRLYIAGYGFLVAEICAAIGLQLPAGRFDIEAARKRARLQSAFIRAALLDMEISQSVYFAAEGAGRAAGLKKVADDLDHGIAAVVAAATETANDLQKSANSMDLSVRATVEQAQAVQAAASLTSANVHAVSAATEEMSRSISEISLQTRRSNEIALESSEAARKSEQLIGQLSDAADQIGGIVGMINEIAGKTNMLALNATIEAARAGEAGRGFAVVASEVKALAAQTAHATEEITRKIGAIQSSTRHVAENIDMIARKTGETSAAATGIAVAVERQGAATEEISRNISQASQSVAEVADNAQAVSRAAEAAGAISGDVLAASRQLTGQAGELSISVQRFLQATSAA